jgi:hypothetical protein
VPEADAFEDLARLGLRAGSITPTGRGVALNLTMTREQYETSKGVVETSFGQLLRIETALELAREASIGLIVQAANGAIMDYGHARRFATRAQARALQARDHGCSFPGASSPPNGPTGTTSCPGGTAAPPTSATSRSSAGRITANSNAKAGPAEWSTGCPGGCHRNGSTRNRNPDRTSE